MRTIVIRRHGAPDQLSLEERPSPVPRSGEVLVHAQGHVGGKLLLETSRCS